MEITENTICKFYFHRPRRRKKRPEAQKIIYRDIGKTQRTIDPDEIAAILGAEIIGEAKEKNKFFPLPFEFFAHAMSKHKEIISAIQSLNGQTMALHEAIENITNNLAELFKDAQIKTKIYINFERRIIFLDIEDEHIDYKLFYFEPI